MTNLYTTFFLTIVFAYLSEPSLRKGRRNIFYAAVIVTLVLFVGLRSGYNDTLAYIRSFDRAEPIFDFLTDPEKMNILHNPLFYGVVALLREFTDDYRYFFMLFAIVDVVLIIRFIRNYCSNYFAYSIFLYWAYGLGVFGLAAMKQITAMAILTIAITALLEKKKKKFFAIVFIAGLIHTYAFLFLLLPLFTSKPWQGKSFCIVFGTGTIILTFNSTVSSIVDYVDSVGRSVSSFEVFDGVQMNPLRIIIFAIVPMLILIYKKQLVPLMTEKHFLLSNMSIISLMFMLLGGINGANMFGRLATYFVYGDICMLGWLIDKLCKGHSKKLMYFISVVLFLSFMIYDNLDFSTTGGYSGVTIFRY